MYKEEIKNILISRLDLRETLFSKGYLLTSDDNISYQDYPFYGIWKKHEILTSHSHNLFLYIHPKQKTTIYEDNDFLYLMIGHAINPFDRVIDEFELLKNISLYNKSVNHNFIEYLNEMTGIFILIVVNKDNQSFKIYQDASGMKAVYYSIIDNNLYVSSHAQLIADLLNLHFDSNIYKLINKKFYSFSNRYLPGNLSPYKEVKRIGGNTYLFFDNNDFIISRFYPIKTLDMAKNIDEVNMLVEKISKLLTTTMEQITRKWNKPAISLTGGTDSKTTLSVANHFYNSYFVYSYISKKQEEVDALAAKNICDKLNIKHHTYKISESNDEVEDYHILKKIIDHNTSYFKKTSDNEIRKLIHFYKTKDFDVEVKSWASETVRVFLDRKYGMSMPKVLNERHLSILQSRYMFSPKLLKFADDKNYEFLKEIELLVPLHNFEHSDLYYWEFRMGAWGSSVVNSFDLCHEVIMPMNNRNILELFLRIPREYRINDGIHLKIIEKNNSQMKETEHVANLYFHNYRKIIEKLYFKFRTVFYRRKK